MNHKLPFILAIGMMIAAVGLFSWQHNNDAHASVEQAEPAPQYRIEDHLTKVEFELDDGTPCVLVSAPSSRPVRLAGPSIPGRGGVSCDWNYEE